jgi:hypothetical protein
MPPLWNTFPTPTIGDDGAEDRMQRPSGSLIISPRDLKPRTDIVGGPTTSWVRT